MGSYDAAAISEFVGLYLLNQWKLIKKGVGLYRDHGFATINIANGPKLDRIRNKNIALFKEERLSTIIETNLIETEFLDITFNHATVKYFPYLKANKYTTIHQRPF